MTKTNQPHELEKLKVFWAEKAAALPWFSRWTETLDWQLPFARWFVGGHINASYACLDTHINTDHQHKVAIHWSDEVGGERTLTYFELYGLVNKMASGLLTLGVRKGDVVVLYVSMIPEAIAAMLAIARIGATHSVVFSGFSAQSLRDRINDANARFVVTADHCMRRGKRLNLKEVVDEALKEAPSVKKTLVIKRDDHHVAMQDGRDVFWHELIKDADDYVEPAKVESSHPLFMLYTSGTTGKPKGIVHSTGGYLTYIYWTMKWVFDPKPTDVYWCTADIGWITGHSYIVYGPLLHGLTMVIYDGAPDYPTTDIWWNLIKKYQVSIFYTSPTALRMFMKLGQASTDLPSLRVLGSVGEPINPNVWHWYHDTIGGKRCPIVDTWWQTETGGVMISPSLGLDSLPLKPGSAQKPMPGIEAAVVDHLGQPVPLGTKGLLVIKQPWPGMTLGIHNDPERFQQVYWSKFPGHYFAGDFAIQDTDGYFWLLGRADEVVNIAGHRIGTAEIESAALLHHDVAEAAAIGVDDDIKGQAIVIFAVLKNGMEPSDAHKRAIELTVKNSIGSFVTPKDIIFIHKLPKTRSGKIMRRVLKSVFEGKQIGDVSTLEDGDAVGELVR